MLPAIILFAVTYVLMISFGKYRPYIALTSGVLFIIFGIEILFLYPWAVHFDELGLFGLAAMALFVFNVSVAYAYEWRRGGLSWD